MSNSENHIDWDSVVPGDSSSKDNQPEEESPGEDLAKDDYFKLLVGAVIGIKSELEKLTDLFHLMLEQEMEVVLCPECRGIQISEKEWEHPGTSAPNQRMDSCESCGYPGVSNIEAPDLKLVISNEDFQKES